MQARKKGKERRQSEKTAIGSLPGVNLPVRREAAPYPPTTMTTKYFFFQTISVLLATSVLILVAMGGKLLELPGTGMGVAQAQGLATP